MSEATAAIRPPGKRALGSMVLVDPESLPFGTNPAFNFHYIDISAATNGRLSIPDAPIEYRDAPSRARRVIKTGDVLMSTVRPNLKAFAYCNLPPGNYIASTGFAVLRALGETDSRYVLYAILSDDVSQQINSLTVGSNYPAINSSDVRRLKIPAFTPPEQRRIAEILSTLDEVIEQTEALIAKMQQVKAGLMHDIFTRGVTPDGRLRPTREQAPELYKESPLGWIPKGWDCEEIGNLAYYYNGNSFAAVQWKSEGLPIIRIQNLNGEDDFNFYNGPLEESWTVRPGDLLFAWAGMRETSFGPRIWIGPMGVLNQHIFKVVVKNQNIESSIFFYYMLRYRLPEIVKAAHGFKDSFFHITRKELGGVLVAMPGKVEQSLMTVKLQTLDDLLSSYSEDLAKLQQKKVGLMQDLLTGHVSAGQSDTFLSKLSAVGAQGG